MDVWKVLVTCECGEMWVVELPEDVRDTCLDKVPKIFGTYAFPPVRTECPQCDRLYTVTWRRDSLVSVSSQICCHGRSKG